MERTVASGSDDHDHRRVLVRHYSPSAAQQLVRSWRRQRAFRHARQPTFGATVRRSRPTPTRRLRRGLNAARMCEIAWSPRTWTSATPNRLMTSARSCGCRPTGRVIRPRAVDVPALRRAESLLGGDAFERLRIAARQQSRDRRDQPLHRPCGSTRIRGPAPGNQGALPPYDLRAPDGGLTGALDHVFPGRHRFGQRQPTLGG